MSVWRPAVRGVFVALAGLGLAACGDGPSAPSAPTTPPDPAQELRADGVSVSYQPADAAWAPRVHADGVAGRENAARFFGAPIAGELRIAVFPDRPSLDVHWRRIWRNPSFRSECWMIASGDAGGVVLLSPGAWSRDACGHDAQDPVHRGRITGHEVVHVHHAQRSPDWSSLFAGLDWFVEGLAVHASGQHDEASQARVRHTLEAGGGPARLAEVLPTGYSFAGSLVAWIDRRHGRATLLDLLDETRESAVLQRLGGTEAELLAAWRRDLAAGR